MADEKKQYAIPEGFKGDIKQSVCKWCFGSYPMAEFCDVVKSMGLVGVDLVDWKDWELVRDHGLTVTMGNIPEVQIRVGINRVENHERLIDSYAKYIPMAAELGVPNVISLSGDRKGMDPQEGLKNCITALKKVATIAEKNKVNVCLELLNSKDHDDYMADSVQWGIDLIKGVGSERVKILFDIYHMHRMEGDVINNIRRAYERYAKLGIDLHVTELDVSCFDPEDKRTELTEPTAEMTEKVATFYEKFFAMLREYKGVVKSVTFWGIADDYTWLDNFPVRGRKNWPLLFDINHQPKEAFWRVAQF